MFPWTTCNLLTYSWLGILARQVHKWTVATYSTHVDMIHYTDLTLFHFEINSPSVGSACNCYLTKDLDVTCRGSRYRWRCHWPSYLLHPAVDRGGCRLCGLQEKVRTMLASACRSFKTKGSSVQSGSVSPTFLEPKHIQSYLGCRP